MENKEIENTFVAAAGNNMISFSISGFKRRYRKLYASICEAMRTYSKAEGDKLRQAVELYERALDLEKKKTAVALSALEQINKNCFRLRPYDEFKRLEAIREICNNALTVIK